MNSDLHNRAKEFIARRRIEGLSAADQRWLESHLLECPSCATENQRMNDALSAFRAMNIDLPRNLGSRTQLRVRMRAEELREHGSANRLIWAVAVVSWIFGLATAPFIWRGFAWLGGELHLPKLIWIAAVALWWLVPGLVAASIVVLQKRRVAREAE